MAEARHYPSGIGVDEARLYIAQICAMYRLPAETIALSAALARVVSLDISAPKDVPGFTNSAMDGFALRSADLAASGDTSLTLIGEALAGGREAPEVSTGTCVRITTGAPLPRGADTVVMKEHTRVESDHVLVSVSVAPGANVRAADEDYRAGDPALIRGQRLTPARLGALASFGMGEVAVTHRPRAVLLTTGDELVEPGQPLGFGAIYDSNRHSLGAFLQQLGVDVIRHERVRDNPVALTNALRCASDSGPAVADIIVSSGGVSAGEADYMPRLLEQIGKIHLWKVRMRPGMPFLFGEINKTLVFALPGNPVSGIATLLALVRPGLDAMTGALPAAPLRARLRQAIFKRHARTEFQRSSIECDESGALWAQALERQGSGMLRGVAEAHGLIVLPEAQQEFAAGSVIDWLPLPGWP